MTEMPTSGDLTLSFSLPPEIQWTLPPSPPPINMGMGHYMKSYMKYILSKFTIIVLMPEIIFVNDIEGAKNAPETILRIKKFKFWAKNGLNLKLRNRKAQKMILSGRYGMVGRMVQNSTNQRSKYANISKNSSFSSTTVCLTTNIVYRLQQ